MVQEPTSVQGTLRLLSKIAELKTLRHLTLRAADGTAAAIPPSSRTGFSGLVSLVLEGIPSAAAASLLSSVSSQTLRSLHVTLHGDEYADTDLRRISSLLQVQPYIQSTLDSLHIDFTIDCDVQPEVQFAPQTILQITSLIHLTTLSLYIDDPSSVKRPTLLWTNATIDTLTRSLPNLVHLEFPVSGGGMAYFEHDPLPQMTHQALIIVATNCIHLEALGYLEINVLDLEEEDVALIPETLEPNDRLSVLRLGHGSLWGEHLPTLLIEKFLARLWPSLSCVEIYDGQMGDEVTFAAGTLGSGVLEGVFERTGDYE